MFVFVTRKATSGAAEDPRRHASVTTEVIAMNEYLLDALAFLGHAQRCAELAKAKLEAAGVDQSCELYHAVVDIELHSTSAIITLSAILRDGDK